MKKILLTLLMAGAAFGQVQIGGAPAAGGGSIIAGSPGTYTLNYNYGQLAPWQFRLLDSNSNNAAAISASGALKVDGSAVTQPVSIAGTVPISGNVGVNGTVPVSGTFFQSTQPVSGTFFQSVQPVSQSGNWVVGQNGSWNVGILGIVSVSGNFFQATQPVSISAPVSVTGTFFQAVQPVSGTVTVNDPDAGTPGQPVPAMAAYVGGIGSGTLKGLTTCDNSTFLQMTTATTTQLVALATNQSIRICHWDIQGSITNTATTLRFISGTGTNCATGLTQLTPAWSLAVTAASAQGYMGAGSGLGEIFHTAPGNALCATNSAAGTVNIFITYTQF